MSYKVILVPKSQFKKKETILESQYWPPRLAKIKKADDTQC